MKGEDIVRIADSFVGTPYRHQGRSRKGVDCWGLLYAIGAEAGILPDGLNVKADYGLITDQLMKAEMSKWCTVTTLVQDGVIAIIKWPGARFAGHMGVLTSDGNIIHAYSIEARVVKHGFRGKWLKMSDSLWKLPSVEYPIDG
jgi:cell wall-associated NlpC family hydrolase